MSKFFQALSVVMLLPLLSIGLSAQEVGITLHVENTPLVKVIDRIERLSGYSFIYTKQIVDDQRSVSLDVKNASIQSVLAGLFSGSDVRYRIEKKQIILDKAKDGGKVRQLVGTVVDEPTSAPLAGVAVYLKGTSVGTMTDDSGHFSLTVSDGDEIEFDCLGYLAVSRRVTAGVNKMDVSMKEDRQALDEVVVVGYGSMRKSDLTGPISSIKGDVLTERSTQMLSTAMQGQISGVEVTRSSGGPGSQATVRVRGVTTLSNNDPLVIIDGVPGSLNDVVASDVETLTVLKDAASASIYGSRAAAGVIMITTKRAKENKFNLDYNYEYSIDKPTARPKVGDAVDWMTVQNEMRWNDGASKPDSQYPQETIDSWMANNASDPYHYPNTDWVNLLLKNTTSHQQHSLNVSGGTDKLQSKFSFNYQTADGYYANKSYDRYAGRVNNDYRINSWIRANIDIDFSTSERISPSSINPVYWAYLLPSYYNPYWEDGRYADVKDGGNALAMINEGGTDKSNYYKFGGKAQLELTPVKGLTLTAVFAPRYSFLTGKKFIKKVNTYYENGNTVTAQSNKTTSLHESRNLTQSRTYQFYANYQNKWNDHSFNAMAGYEGYKYKWENLGASRTNYELDTYPYLNLGPEDYQYNSGNAGHNAYQSVFGRVSYSFKDRYMLQANVRADASSRFAADYRWGVFPSVSAGWVASSEPWFPKGIQVDYLKVRASIGSLGNERISDSEFPYQAAINFGNSYMYDKGSRSVKAVQNAAQQYYAFNNITWETTTTYDIGVDLALLDSRLSFTGDYYYKKTSDMLLTLGFPSYAGFSAPKQNAGDMHTHGWEIEAGWRDRIGDFSYGVSFNLSDYRSKMGYLGDRRTIDGNRIYEEGSYYYEWFMYKTDGLYVTDADLYDSEGKKYPTLTANDKAGNIKYVDVNGDGVINADDKVRLGNSLPEFQYGGNIFLGWKNLDFSLSFQGVGHQKVLFNSYWIRPLEDWGNIPSLVMGNYWSQNNTEEQNRNAKYPRLTVTNYTNNYTGSDYWLFNGAYFRVKNITLGYSLPQKLMDKCFIKGLRIYASINDLPAISHYPKGWDPEVGLSSDFISTSFTFGANVKF